MTTNPAWVDAPYEAGTLDLLHDNFLSDDQVREWILKKHKVSGIELEIVSMKKDGLWVQAHLRQKK